MKAVPHRIPRIQNKKRGIMKPNSALPMFAVLLLLVAVAGAATTTQDAASLVHVSSVKIDPEVFYPYEVGTITITLMNSGDQAVGLSNPDILDNNIHIVNKNTWNTISYIGAGSTITYTFQVTADPPDGTYFPLFSVGTEGSGSIHFPLIIKVDSTELKASIAEKPDNFSLSTKDKVNLSLINPRDAEIEKILITPTGPGIDISPAIKYVSSLGAGSSIEIPFSVTPHQESDLTFHISYSNGDNAHSADVVLPITLGEDKFAAKPIVNNVALTRSGAYYSLSGDVNNAGLTDAKSMVITVGAPARAVEPYSEYAIGSLASDDFSSFEVTFTANDLSSVPLVISWKDNDGNSFSATKNLDLRGSSGSSGNSGSTSANTGSSGSSGTATTTSGSASSRSGGGPQGGGSIFTFGGSRGGGISSFYPVLAAGILLIGGIVLYRKRKWIAAKVTKR
jgi:hypothetical protein